MLKYSARCETTEKDYEIFVNPPSWQMSKYLFDNVDVLCAEPKDRDMKAIGQIYDDVLGECLIGWKEVTGVPKDKRDKIPMVTEEKKKMLPGMVTAKLVLELIDLSKGIANVRIKLEKN